MSHFADDDTLALIERLKQQLAAKDAELEGARMQLVACGVVASANTRDSAEAARQMHPDYMCPAVKDVIRAVDREMELREQLAEREKSRATAIQLRYIIGDIPAGNTLNYGENVAIALASYFSGHIDRPYDDPIDSETGWSEWCISQTNTTLDAIVTLIEEHFNAN